MSSQINQIRKLLSQGTFFRQVTVLAGGTAIGQGILVLTLPLLTRLYTPDDLGRFGLLTAFINIASVGASLLYEAGIVAANSEEDAAHLTTLSLILAIFTTPIATLGFFILINFNIIGFGTIPVETVFWIPVALLLTVAFQTLRYWLIRKNLFALISKVTVMQNLIKSFGQLGLGLTPLGWIGLLVADVLGRGFGVGRILKESKQDLFNLTLPIQLQKLFSLAHRNLEFPIYSLPSSLIDSLASSLSVPILTHLYGTTAAGYFLLAQRTLALPLSLISNSVADAFHSQVASYARYQPTKVNPFFWRTAKTLILVGLIPTIGLALISPHIFSWVFGATWAKSGFLVALIAPWSLAGLVVSPLSRIVFVVRGLKWKLFYDVVALTILLLVFYCGSTFDLSLTSSVSLLSILNIIAYGLYFWILLRIMHSFSKQNIADV
ncbi:lipopolysaccharide biosynthesis protein [Anabaena sp. WFMT]|uniref:lipopolysaccharide biosynthesis protein n=1 Tax=Anabaena sp. WFMT TaxID=3449730 RepID=UPI003F211038